MISSLTRWLWRGGGLPGVLLGLVGIMAHGEEPAAAKTAITDAEYSRRLVGTWEDQYEGHRTMTVRNDGTATMLIELRGWKAALYASRLGFDMVWSVANGHMKKRTVGGEPAGRVKAILKMLGDHVSEPILELTDERLVLQDQDGKRKYEWTRVKSSEESAGKK